MGGKFEDEMRSESLPLVAKKNSPRLNSCRKSQQPDDKPMTKDEAIVNYNCFST